jgi:hypothetical protein
MLVARLNVIKVSADVPLGLEARAQRAASNTDDVNSAREKSVSCDNTFRIRIVRSGLLATNAEEYGCCMELL